MKNMEPLLISFPQNVPTASALMLGLINAAQLGFKCERTAVARCVT